MGRARQLVQLRSKLARTRQASRYFLQRDPEALWGGAAHPVLRVIEARLRERSGSARGRLGAVSFVQRFGSALNVYAHFHCCVIDGVFAVGEDGQSISPMPAP